MSRPVEAILVRRSHPNDDEASCPTCGRLLARYRASEIDIDVLLDDEPTGDTTYVARGYRVELEPDFVNLGTRHRSGRPWYGLPTRRRPRSASTIRVPAIVTCSCRTEVFLPAEGDPVFSSGSREAKRQAVQDEMDSTERKQRRRWRDMIDTPD